MVRVDRLKRRLENQEKAFEALLAAQKKFVFLNKNDYWYVSARDSLIQSFEFTIDLLWKCLKEYMEVNLKLQPKANPKGVAKDALENSLLTKDEYDNLIEMLDYRNLTSHTYEESLAEDLSEKIIQMFPTLENIICKLIKNLNI